jgi:hypothetical protein
MKIALYKMMYGDGAYSLQHVAVYREPDIVEDAKTVRISEPVEVEFPPLSEQVVIEKQLKAIDAKEREIRERFQRALDVLNDDRQKLQALTVQP